MWNWLEKWLILILMGIVGGLFTVYFLIPTVLEIYDSTSGN